MYSYEEDDTSALRQRVEDLEERLYDMAMIARNVLHDTKRANDELSEVAAALAEAVRRTRPSPDEVSELAKRIARLALVVASDAQTWAGLKDPC